MSLACSSASPGVTRIRSESCFQWGIKGMSPRVCIFICDRVGHIADYCHLGAHNAVGLARPPVGIASAVLCFSELLHGSSSLVVPSCVFASPEHLA